jgi:hypothetical protein
MAGDVLLDLVAGEVAGIEFVAGRHGVGAHKGTVLIDEIPAAAHNNKETPDGGVLGGAQEIAAGQVALAPIDFVEQAAGVDQLFDHLAFLRG